MHDENIEAAKREVLRLLDQTRKVLKDVADRPDLLHEPDPEQPRQLDTEKAKEWRSVLISEIRKVKKLEAVFAVMGTVKAGKSTTINAIVGAEILPNRPEPMTTYPTLISHKPGQIEPVLNFPVARNFNALVRRAKKTLEKETEIPLDERFPDPHKQEIVRKVLEEKLKIEPCYKGRAEVLDLLKTVNDLYRLCGQLKLELPKTVTDNPPRLEIEMQHVGASDTGVGQLSVLDLPGPNEFGQSERLREIVQTQLKRASAVVLVTDFTQRGTQADKEIQKLVEDELDHLTNRLFIFVNKFDQRRSDDWGEEETRQYLAKTLINGIVKPEHIYPVSALKAFLANWAQRQLKESGQLPGPEASSLTKDFSKAAFGEMWEDEIEQIDKVQRGADRLWEKSRFADPLDNVISVAARDASLVCFKAAIGKLLDYNRTLDSFLKIRDGATTNSLKKLRGAIETLQGEIGKISKKKETVEGRIKARLDEFPEIIRAGCEGWSNQLRHIIEQYFKTGKPSPSQGWIKEHLRKLLDHIGKRVPAWFRKPLDIPAQQTGRDFPPRKTRKFRGSDHVDQAQKSIESIRDRLKSVYDEAERQIEQRLNKISEKLSSQIATDVEKELRNILEEARKGLKRDFQVTLDFPKLELNIDTAELEEIASSVVKQESEFRRTGRKKKTHPFAPVTRFLGEIFEKDDWGYDAVYKEQQISTINMAILQVAAMKELEHFSSKMQSRAEDLAQSQAEAVSSYFDNLKEYLGAFRGDLLDACEDKQREASSLKESHDRIQKFLSDVEDVLHDTEKFNESLEASDGAERPSR